MLKKSILFLMIFIGLFFSLGEKSLKKVKINSREKIIVLGVMHTYASNGDFTSSNFMIDTSDFSPGGKKLKKGTTAKEQTNFLLGTIIQKLMIALGVIALFIMTIGAGYMILYHGQDEYLTKGKNIFIAGIFSLIIALSSYYLVNLVGFILYK